MFLWRCKAPALLVYGIETGTIARAKNPMTVTNASPLLLLVPGTRSKGFFRYGFEALGYFERYLSLDYRALDFAQGSTYLAKGLHPSAVLILQPSLTVHRCWAPNLLARVAHSSCRQNRMTKVNESDKLSNTLNINKPPSSLCTDTHLKAAYSANTGCSPLIA